LRSYATDPKTQNPTECLLRPETRLFVATLGFSEARQGVAEGSSAEDRQFEALDLNIE
jgi:hypothetical protein